MPGCQSEHKIRSGNIGMDRLDRRLDNLLDANRSGQVVHNIAVCNQATQEFAVEDGIQMENECRIAQQVRDVCARPGGEVIQHRNLVALEKQSFRKMGPDEASSAGNENSHYCSSAAGSL